MASSHAVEWIDLKEELAVLCLPGCNGAGGAGSAGAERVTASSILAL
jgi:hypothetical protein